MGQLQKLLTARYVATTDPLLDAVVGICVGSEQINFIPTQKRFITTEVGADLVLYFDTIKTVQQVLGNVGAALEAFRDGRLQSSGYIMWTFQVLGLFTPVAE